MPDWPVSGKSTSTLGGPDTGFLDQYPLDSNAPYRSIFCLFIAANLWTLLMITIPVVTNLPPHDYYTQPHWYSGDDVMRFLEPIGGTSFQFWLLYMSGIFKENMNHGSLICVGVFFLGLAIYNQGAGFHSSANMFKNALETVMGDDDRGLENLHYFMKSVWEHAVSHYLYAGGYGIMNFAQFWAYRNMKAPYMGLTKTGKVLLVLSSIVFGLLIAGVAVEFPAGTIVALVYLLVYGMSFVGGYMVYQYKKNGDSDMFKFGMKPIVHHFFLGYCIALFIVVIWIISVGGFKTRKEAGYK